MARHAKGRPLSREDLDQWSALQRRLKETEEGSGPAVPPHSVRGGTQIPPVEKGYNHLLLEHKPAITYQVFAALLQHGAAGLCITHMYPKKVRAMYGIAKGTILWLSDWYGASAELLHIGPEERTLRPSRLEFEVMKEIASFVKRPPPTLFVLDGVEALVLANGFEKVMTFLVNLTHMASANQATVVVTADPGVFDDRQQQALQRIFEKVIDLRTVPPGMVDAAVRSLCGAAAGALAPQDGRQGTEGPDAGSSP